MSISIYLDVVRTDFRSDALEFPESTVRAIGEILPFVIAKYGIDFLEVARELPQGFDDSI